MSTKQDAAPATKPKRTRRFRGQDIPVDKTTRDLRTGALYDHITYKRSVTNRKDGTVSDQTLSTKLRRPGTGGQVVTEVEVEE
jgi:hypothetical protein